MANWIAGAIGQPGALHRQLGIPAARTIPAGRLAAAARAGGVLGQRARLAETLKGLPHRARGGRIQPGQPVVVGEGGPEVVVPRMASRVLPHVGGGPQNSPGLVRARSGRANALMGGGGMAVGPLHSPRGMPLNPVLARRALVAGLRG